MIKRYELIVNNDTDFPTQLSSPGISIIDLALTSPDLGPLRIWKIPEEYLSLSDHEFILIKWEEIDIPDQKDTQAVISGWSIKTLLKDDKQLKDAEKDWKKVNRDHHFLDLLCTKQDLDKEVGWFEEKLTELLNKYAKVTKITFYSKR